MATHEVAIRENTGATSTGAPFLGKYVVKGNMDGAEVIAKVAVEAKLTDTVARAIVEGTFDVLAEEEREGLTKFNLGPLTVYAVVTGSFPSSDAAFDAERNRLLLTVRFDDETRLCLADITPSIVTDATATKVRIDTVTDVDTPRPYSVIHGQNPFKCQGYNLVMTDEGANIRLVNRSGQTFACIVDETGGRGYVIAHTAELLEGGDYKVVITSRGGDAEGSLQTARRNVKYLHVENPPPGPEPEAFAITGMDSPTTESPNVKRGNPFTMHGTGFDAFDAEAGDRCEVRLHDGESEWSDMPDGDMTVGDGTTILFDQAFWSDIGWDEIEPGTEVDFRLTIGGESKAFTATVAASE